jgi:hypothetical protein
MHWLFELRLPAEYWYRSCAVQHTLSLTEQRRGSNPCQPSTDIESSPQAAVHHACITVPCSSTQPVTLKLIRPVQPNLSRSLFMIHLAVARKDTSNGITQRSTRLWPRNGCITMSLPSHASDTQSRDAHFSTLANKDKTQDGPATASGCNCRHQCISATRCLLYARCCPRGPLLTSCTAAVDLLVLTLKGFHAKVLHRAVRGAM